MKQSTPPALAFLDRALLEAQRQHLLRQRPAPAEASLSLCSNDYLGLASLPGCASAAGAGASRLVSGDRPVHADLERWIARFVGQAEALVFTSGYAANVGLLSALPGPGDVVVSDALNHASIIDGVRLSRARVCVVPHGSVEAVDRALADARPAQSFVVTESYFSMDADAPDLRALRAVCDAHGAALLVDEAHALGVLGPEGRGRCAELGVCPDALVGTFGKAFGASGAFVAGCPSLTAWLWNRARSFVFSTAISPAAAATALQGLQVAFAEPSRRERTMRAAAQLREGLQLLGVSPLGFGHIVPWVLGDAASAVAAAEALREAGLDVRAIRPPSVPPGTARLRLTVTARHTEEDIARALAAIAALPPHLRSAPSAARSESGTPEARSSEGSRA